MIFQLNIITQYRYIDYTEEVSGSLRNIRTFIGSPLQLQTELEWYKGIDLIYLPSGENHQPYITVRRKVRVI